MQLALDLSPRQLGERAMTLAADKAQREGMDYEGARKFVLGYLARHGQVSGEDLTDAMVEHGFRPTEQRAFGAVFAVLSRKGLIRCVGYCDRAKGHGTSGGRVWARCL